MSTDNPKITKIMFEISADEKDGKKLAKKIVEVAMAFGHKSNPKYTLEKAGSNRGYTIAFMKISGRPQTQEQVLEIAETLGYEAAKDFGSDNYPQCTQALSLK